MKKTKYLLSIILTVIFIFSTAAPAAALDADKFEARQVTAYLFSMEKTATVTCLFDRDLPEIPYIDVYDYFDIFQIFSFTFSKSGDGTYSLSKKDAEMKIDTENDTVRIDHFLSFLTSDAAYTDGSYSDAKIIDTVSRECDEEEKPLILDFSAYNIDVIEKNGRVYFPVSVLNDIVVLDYIAALYIDGSLYLTNTHPAYQQYFSIQPVFEQSERSEALAEFTYNELCFQIDNFYGCPSIAKISKLIEEVGFDRALDLYDENTPIAKQLLKSASLIDFHLGLCWLSYEFSDGGHTQLYYAAVKESRLYDNEFSRIWNENFESNATDIKWLHGHTMYFIADWQTSLNIDYIIETKQECLKQYDKVMEWKEIAVLYICGDTAVFSFNTFVSEVVLPFKQSLDYAKEHGIKNFVLDLTTNRGGTVSVSDYFAAMITNKNTKNANMLNNFFIQNTKNTYTSVKKADLNLDGKIDDLDNDVIYDFDFALLTTSKTFSAASYLTEYAKENGVMIIGEKNGGGSCSVGTIYTPSSGYLIISLPFKRLCSNGDDLEGKGEVYVNLTKPYTGGRVYIQGVSDLSVFGYYDYDDFYDFEALGGYIDEFYDKGDVNGDGYKNNKDVTELFNYVSEDNEYAAKYDINSNGKINNKDVFALFKKVSAA